MLIDAGTRRLPYEAKPRRTHGVGTYKMICCAGMADDMYLPDNYEENYYARIMMIHLRATSGM